MDSGEKTLKAEDRSTDAQRRGTGRQYDWHRRGQRRDKEPESAAQRDIFRPLAFALRLDVMIRGW